MTNQPKTPSAMVLVSLDDLNTIQQWCKARGWNGAANGLLNMINTAAPAEQTPAVGGELEVIAIIESALRRSFSLGQIYWQQADSDSTCQQNKSDQTMETQAHHIVMVTDSVRKLYQTRPATAKAGEPFQARVLPWMLECFGAAISADTVERNHRFLEEALELVQACGATQGEAHQLVDYVYGRDTGEPVQEVGGVMVTLAALCLAHKMDMHEAGEVELGRIWTKVSQIRAKQAAKPAMSPLPGSYPDRTP